MKITTAIFFLTLPFTLFAFYLIYCTLNRTQRWRESPFYVRWLAFTYLLIGVLLDCLFNVTFGTAMFLEWPHPKRLMFTARCARWRRLDPRALTWRGQRARWVCESWLNVFEDHC